MFKAPSIETINNKKLVGHSTEMSVAENKTFELFSDFMPNRKQIKNTIGEDIYEVLLYDATYFETFNPSNKFIKWATVEVLNYKAVPEGMDSLDVKEGLYAVFKYKGMAENFHKLMTYIFTEWLPKSAYQLDNRPHFQIVGNKYKNGSPDSEEDVYIPIKKI